MDSQPIADIPKPLIPQPSPYPAHPHAQRHHRPSTRPSSKNVTCIFMGVMECATKHPDRTLQMLRFHFIRLPQQEPPPNSVLGPGIKVKIYAIATRFPSLCLGSQTLGQHPIIHLCTLSYVFCQAQLANKLCFLACNTLGWQVHPRIEKQILEISVWEGCSDQNNFWTDVNGKGGPCPPSPALAKPNQHNLRS